MKMRKNVMFFMVLCMVFCIIISGGYAAASKRIVKIAWFGPLTGPDSYQGMGPRNCFDLAIKQANASGKFPFEIQGMILDDASDTAKTTAGAIKATSDPDVVAGTGHWIGQCAFASIPVWHVAGKPFVLWGVPEKQLISENVYPEITRVCPTTLAENVVLNRVVVDLLGYKKFSSVSDTTEWGKETHSTFADLLKEDGGEILSLDRFEWGTKNFRPVITKIQAIHPQAIYFGGIITEAIVLKKQLHDAGMNILVCSNSGITEQAFNDSVGAEVAEGTVATSPWYEEGVLWEKFKRDYNEVGYKEDWGVYGPFCYQSTQIILKALEEVGPDNPKALVDAIQNMEYTGIVGLTKFDSEGEAIETNAKVVVSQDGVWVPWEDSEYAVGKRLLPSK